MIEQTLVILKPDIARKGLEFKVLERIKDKGFEIVAMYRDSPSIDIFREHYKTVIAEKGEKIGKNILNYITSGPVIVALIKGNNAVSEMRKFGGEKTQAKDCSPGTIRYDFSNDTYDLADLEGRAVENAIHTSDSPESAVREIELWFSGYVQALRKEIKDEYKQIADSIALDSVDWIKDIVKVSNEKKFLYHGRKNVRDKDAIVREGLKPVTPEGGDGEFCRFFSTGLGLFYPFYDSSFFNYSGNGSNPNEIELNLAMTNYDLLASAGLSLPPYERESQLIIKETIPFNAIAMLNVRLRHPGLIMTNPEIPADKNESIRTGRKYRQIAEQMLLMGIASQLYNEFTPGKIVEYSRDIRGDSGGKQ